MQSLLMAISDLISSFLYKVDDVEAKPSKKTIEVPVGYRPLFFHCWLCQGKTNFALKNSIKKKKFTMECSRCGVENIVTVNS
jgi:hypothetical protein